MRLREAQDIASSLILSLDRYCVRVAVAGSVRREVPECKDIELVAIPRWEERWVRTAESLFPDARGDVKEPFNLLHEWATSQTGIVWIKPGTPATIPWHPRPDGKYWRGLLRDQVKLDLFLTTHDQWGLLFLIRTGSAEFTEALVKHGWRVGKRSLGGHLRAGDTEDAPIIPTPEERDVFKELGLAWVPPPLRTGPEALLALKEIVL